MITSLPDVAMVGMPAALALETDARLVAAGSPAEIEIQFGNSRGPGDAFELRYNGLELAFSFDGDDGTGFNFDGFSDDVLFNDFFAAFAANFYLSRDFDISITNNAPADRSILLVSKTNGTANNIIMVPLYGGSTETPGVDDEYAPNFEVLAQIWANVDGWAQANLVKGATDNDDQFSIFVHETLRELLQHTPPPPYFSGAGHTDRFGGVLDGAVVPWYARVYEQYGDPPLIRNPYAFGSAASPKYALDFAVPRKDIGIVANIINPHFVDTSNRKVLHNRTAWRVHKSQTAYICVLVPAFSSGSANTNTNFTIHKLDGTTQSFTSTKDMSPTQPELAYFAVDVPYILGMEDAAYKLTFRVKGFWNGNWETELITLYIDRQEHEQMHHFMYRNRKGGWESVYLTGHVQEQREYNRAEAILEHEDYATDAEAYTYNHKLRSAYVQHTGLKSREERLALAELADSPDVYRLIGTYGTMAATWQKVIVDPKGFEKLDDSLSDDIDGFEFVFKPALTEY